MKTSFKSFWVTLLFSTVTLFSNNCFAEKLYIYNWTEYIPSTLLSQFTKETGIDVIYSTFESNEEMFSKLKLTHAPYDLIFPSSYYINKMAKEGMLQKIDHSKLSNFNQITPSLLNQSFDPQNQYSLPYVFGLTGIGINVAEIDPKKVTRWQDLWKPEFKKSLLLTNDSREVFHIALLVKGFSPNTQNKQEIKQAYQLLTQLVPNILTYNSDSPDVPYLQGEVDLGMIWNGSAFRATKENPDIQFIYPKEGAIFWIDNYAIPKQARNVDAAYKFIDFMLRPESAKVVIETMGFSMPNEGVKALLPPEDANNTVLFPPAEEIKKGEIQGDVGKAIDTYEKYWNRLKTAK